MSTTSWTAALAIHTRWTWFAAFCIVLFPLCAPGLASPTVAILAIAIFLGLLALNWRYFASWLVILALMLLLLPAVFMGIVLVERMLGIPAFVSGASLVSQTTGVVTQAVVCTVEFAAGVALAWLWNADSDAAIPVPPVGGQPYLRAPAIGGLLFVWLFALTNFQLQAGGSVFSGTYGFLPSGAEVFFSGAWPALANLALLLIEIHARHWRRPGRVFLNGLWIIQFLVFLAHGNRADLLAGMFILLLIRVATFRRQLVVLIIGAAIGVPFLTFVVQFRALAPRGNVSLSTVAAYAGSSIFNLRSFGDVGDVSVTTTAGIYMIEAGREPLLKGKSYVNYVLHLVPSALRGGFQVTGTDIYHQANMGTNGGMTPVSEAYFNFAWWGCLLVGLIHGWLIAWVHRRRLHSPSPLWVGIYTVGVAYSFRCYFYGPSDLVKVEFALLLYLGAAAVLNALGSRETAPAHSSFAVR